MYFGGSRIDGVLGSGGFELEVYGFRGFGFRVLGLG